MERKIKARELSSLLVNFHITWDDKPVLDARPGWGPSARKYTFYKHEDGIEHRTLGSKMITVELTAKEVVAKPVIFDAEYVPSDAKEVVVLYEDEWVACFNAPSLEAADLALTQHGYQRTTAWLEDGSRRIASLVRG